MAEDDVIEEGASADAETPGEDVTPVEEPVAEAAADEPAAEAASDEAVTEAVEEPAAEPVAETPSAEAAAEEPVAETPAAAEAAAEEPVAETPAAAEAAAEEPVAKPGSEQSVAGSTDAPGDSAPAESPVEKRKKKRLPRALRPTRTKRKRGGTGERKPIVRLPKPEGERGRRQERQGTVVSDAMDKTIVVKVDVIRAHPKYKKVVRRSVKFHAHDEGNTAKVGDVVRIVETRPLSATKHWRLAEILEEAK